MSSLSSVSHSQHDTRCAAARALGLIGESAQMRDILWQIEKAGETRAGVLITGEEGSGRGLVARAIHACNRVADTPFVPLYCDRQDASTIEHRLFGSATSGIGAGPASATAGTSARASATANAAARVDRDGFVEQIASGSLLHQACGGTIYFRHIEEMPDRTQARLSRYFRDREAVIDHSTEAGSDGLVFDVRPMLAANTDFPDRVAEGLVRQDLYRRFAKVCIQIPPLRERREDIPALAAFLVTRASQAIGLPGKVLTEAAVTVLSSLPWKGNTRELQTVLAALVSRVETFEITLADVLAQLHLDGPVARPASAEERSDTLRAARERFEREHIAAVLDKCRGRIPDAAKALGIQRTNLYRKMRELHVPRRGKPATGK